MADKPMKDNVLLVTGASRRFDRQGVQPGCRARLREVLLRGVDELAARQLAGGQALAREAFELALAALAEARRVRGLDALIAWITERPVIPAGLNKISY
jgi:hypothetical protein